MNSSTKPKIEKIVARSMLMSIRSTFNVMAAPSLGAAPILPGARGPQSDSGPRLTGGLHGQLAAEARLEVVVDGLLARALTHGRAPLPRRRRLPGALPQVPRECLRIDRDAIAGEGLADVGHVAAKKIEGVRVDVRVDRLRKVDRDNPLLPIEQVVAG